MSLLDRIRECNAHDIGGFRPFEVAGTTVGWIRHAFAERLAGFADVFRVHARAVRLADDLADFRARTDAVEAVLRGFAEDGTIQGWRGEKYPVATSWGAPPLLQMERAAVPWFGVRAYGVHVNGYIRTADGISMWVARRARGKQTYPGMLDNMVAGGQPVGIGIRENLIKECAEEAAIPPELARRAVPVGAISYTYEGPEGLKPDVQFVYDLELPAEFLPRNTDGEVESFHLWPIERVAGIVAETQEFKFNCNLVVIDFLVRHGLIGPDHPDYLEIVRGLHR